MAFAEILLSSSAGDENSIRDARTHDPNRVTTRRARKVRDPIALAVCRRVSCPSRGAAAGPVGDSEPWGSRGGWTGVPSREGGYIKRK